MKLVILITNILYFKLGLSINNPSKIQLIADVVASYEQPTSVVAVVCWKPVYKVKLAKILARERNISIRYGCEPDIIGNRKPNNHLFFIIDAKCPNYLDVLNQASANKLFNKSYRWLLLGSTAVLMDELTNLNILIDSEFLVTEEQDSGDVMLYAGNILDVVYQIKPRTEYSFEYYSTWTNKDGLNKSQDMKRSTAMRRRGLKGHEIASSIVIMNNKTKYDLMDLSDTLTDPLTKSTFHSLNNLYEFLDVSKVLIFRNSWGYFVNGSWTGMIRDLQSEKAELCGSCLFMTADRLGIVEYITTAKNMPTARIVFRQPPLSYQSNLFTLPFTLGVWYCLCGFVVMLIIILYVTAKWDIKKHEAESESTVNENYLGATWSDFILFVVIAISQQGSPLELKGTQGRVVTFLMFLAFLFFYTSYSACIVVLLQSTSDQIRTITDLTYSKLEFGIEDTIYNRYYYSAAFATDPYRKAFYDHKISPKGTKANFMSLEEGVKKIRSSPFGFEMNSGIGYKIMAKYFQEHEKCGLVEIDYVGTGSPWHCSRKGSPFIEIYRIGFFRLEEHGLNDRINRLIFAKKPLCATRGGNFESVKMVDFYPLLLLILYGMILSFAILILEICVYRRQNKGTHIRNLN